MDLSLISLIFTALIAFIIASGFIWGVIRGLKKTALRGAWLLITAIVVFFFAGLFVDFLYKLNISFLNLKIDGTLVTSAEQLIRSYTLKAFSEDIYITNPQLFGLIVKVFKLILNSLAFVLLFFVLKYLLFPVNAIFVRIFFPSAKVRYKREQRKAQTKRRDQVLGFANKSGDSKGKNVKFSSLSQIRNDNFSSVDNSTPDLSEYEKRLKALQEENEKLKRRQVEIKKSEEEILKVNKIIEKPVEVEETKSTKTKSKKRKIKTEFIPIEKKHRFLGGLVGIAMGLFLSAITVMPIIGVFELTQEINSHKAILLAEMEDKPEYRNKGYISAVTDNKYDEITDIYAQSTGRAILTYTGAEFFGKLIFTQISSFKEGGVRVYLSQDLRNVMNTVEKFSDLYQLDLGNAQNFSVDQLDNALDKMEIFIDSIYEIKLINVLGNAGMGTFFNIIENEYLTTTNLTEDLKINEFIITSFNKIKTLNENGELSFSDTKYELKKLLNILRELNRPFDDLEVSSATVGSIENIVAINQQDSLLKCLISDSIDDPLEIIDILNPEYINNIISIIFDMKIGATVMPDLTNLLVNFIFEETNIDFYKNENITSENLNETIQLMINSSFDIYEKIYFENGDIDNFRINDYSALKSLGKMIDGLKNNILTPTSYQNAINKLKTLIKDQIDEIDTELLDIANSLKKVVDKITSTSILWEAEMANLGTALNLINDMEFIDIFSQEINMDNLSLTQLGLILESLKTISQNEYPHSGESFESEIFATTIDESNFTMLEEILNSSLAYIKTTIDTDDYSQFLISAISKIQYNLEMLVEDGERVDWARELGSIDGLFQDGMVIINKNSLDFNIVISMINSPDDVGGQIPLLASIGRNLDKIQDESKLLINLDEIVLELFQFIQEELEKSIEESDEYNFNKLVDETIGELINNLQNNIIAKPETSPTHNSYKELSWEDELFAIYRILDGISPVILNEDLAKSEIDILKEDTNILENLGEGLDLASAQVLLGGDFIKNTLTNILTLLTDSFENFADNSIEEVIFNTFDKIKENLTNNNVLSWKSELAIVGTFLDFTDLQNLTEEDNIKALFREILPLIRKIERFINIPFSSEKSVLISNEVVQTAVVGVLDLLTDNSGDEELGGHILDSINAVKTNLASISDFNEISTWEIWEYNKLVNTSEPNDDYDLFVAYFDTPNLIVPNYTETVTGYFANKNDINLSSTYFGNFGFSLAYYNNFGDTYSSGRLLIRFKWDETVDPSLIFLEYEDFTGSLDLVSGYDVNLSEYSNYVVVKFPDETFILPNSANATQINKVIGFWEKEMTYLGYLFNLEINEDLVETLMDNPSDSYLPKALDAIASNTPYKKSILITNQIIANLLNQLIEPVLNNFEDTPAAFTTLINNITDNLNNVGESNISWVVEFNAFANLKSALTGENNNYDNPDHMVNFGVLLDSIVGNNENNQKSVIITNSAIATFVASIIDDLKVVSHGSQIEEEFNDLLTAISSNITTDANSITKWEYEFSALSTLKGTQNLSGGTLNDFQSSFTGAMDTIYKNHIISNAAKPVICLKKDNFTTLLENMFDNNISTEMQNLLNDDFDGLVDIIKSQFINVYPNDSTDDYQTYSYLLKELIKLINDMGELKNAENVNQAIDELEKIESNYLITTEAYEIIEKHAPFI